MSDFLTTKAFWQNYWNLRENTIAPVITNDLIGNFLSEFINDKSILSALELGGFPGYYSVVLKKMGIQTSLLDYVVIDSYLQKFLSVNNLTINELPVLEQDLFTHTPASDYTFDLVYSIGLVEHFDDTENAIVQHLKYLNSNGYVLILVPNFNGINGKIQKWFDKPNLEVHNLQSMNPKLQKEILVKNGLKNVQSGYFGGFSVWLEDKEKKPVHARLITKVIWIMGKLISKIIPLKGKWFSPYIYAYANK